MLSPDEYLASIERDSADFAALIREGDLDAHVASCPGWTLRDLAGHLGGVHRWATTALSGDRPGEQPEPPAESELADWFEVGAKNLVTELRELGTDAEVWTFGPAPRLSSFWYRRQAHETAMHLWDAQASQGRPARMATDLAIDGVAEVVELMFPRQVRRGRIAPLAAGIRVVLEQDPDHPYVIAGDGTDPAARYVATITGSAQDVLLTLWRRASLASLKITGDPVAVANAFEAGLTP